MALRTHDLDRAHAVGQRLDDSIRREIPHVDRVLIHYEPVAKDRVKESLHAKGLEYVFASAGVEMRDAAAGTLAALLTTLKPE